MMCDTSVDNCNSIISSFLTGVTVLEKSDQRYLITSELRRIFDATWSKFDDRKIDCFSALANKKYNRYQNILPYDFNRVKLPRHETKNSKFCDYINASHVEHDLVPRKYIMCQGPLYGTCYSFWRMVIDQKVRMIVMLGNFVEQNIPKVFEYFPINMDPDLSTKQFGNLIIRCCDSEYIGKIFVKRRLRIEDVESGETYEIIHFHFVSWSDFGVPSKVEYLETLLNVMNNCCKEEEASKMGPIVVHCSAGVGRSGVFVYVDVLLSLLSEASLDSVDYIGELISIRKQRMKCIQTFPQFMYALQVLKLMYPKIANWGTISPVKQEHSTDETADQSSNVDQVLSAASEVKRRRLKSFSNVNAESSRSSDCENSENFEPKPPPCPTRTTSLMVTSVEYETLESLPIQGDLRPQPGFLTPDVQSSKSKRPFFNITKTDSRLLLRQKLGNKRKIATSLRKSLTSKFRKLEKNDENSFVECDGEDMQQNAGVKKPKTDDLKVDA